MHDGLRKAALPRGEAGAGDGIWPLALDGVRFQAGSKPLIGGLSLSLSPGSRSVVMGPNGAGKSLFLRLIAGLLQPTAGRISYGGRAADAAALRRIALVFQRPVVLRRSVAANLRHALATYGVPRAERARRVDALLALGQLEALADRPARVLSGGEQQRLSLVGQAAAAGVKIVMVTHDRGQAQRLADEVLFLHRGALAERTQADIFFNRPNSAAAQAYLEGRLLL
jgi:tungstate transport system ATP-binding protein